LLKLYNPGDLKNTNGSY